MSSRTAFEIVRGIILLAVSLFGLVYLVVQTIRKAEDPARMLFNWVLTAPIVGFMVFVVAPIVGQGGYGAAFGGIPMTALCGLFLAFIWRQSLCSLLAKPFSDLYDGGSIPPDPHPAYSVAQAHQKQGRYLEAAMEVRKQLDRFPTDVEGQLLLAEIQATGLKDLSAAELTIQRFLDQPGHAPANIAFALYSLADWQLQVAQDREAARVALEKITELLPNSEFALGAAQRIAHLGSTEMLLAPFERKTFAVAEGVKNLGLLHAANQPKPVEKDPQVVVAELVQHLEQHPLDTEARERLAVLYADHYSRLDLAADQLEQMIQQPKAPERLIVHWLNLLADLQIRGGADYETVKATLQRVIDRNPEFAAAEKARRRLGLLKLELKAKAQTQTIQLGTYEQDLGLKGGTYQENLGRKPSPPTQPPPAP